VNRSEYLANVMRSLDFLTESARTEVLADMEELYDGFSERGMDDRQIQDRIGSPCEVAAEYRLSEELDRLEQSPGATSGMRIAYASLTGRLARGAAFQLFGLVWLLLSICTLSLVICAVAGVVLSIAAVTGYEPLVTTLAVPGIPASIGALMGVSSSAAAIALLLGNRLLMRALSRWMRRRLRRRHAPGEGAKGATDGRSSGQGSSSSTRRWLNSGRAVWQIALAAVVLASVGAALTPVLDAPEYLLVVDRQESLPVSSATTIEVHADQVDVRVAVGEQAEARLTGDFRRTFAQGADLLIEMDGTAIRVEATNREGLSWGINPKPVLVVTLPQDHIANLIVYPSGGRVDLAGLPAQLSELVRVEER